MPETGTPVTLGKVRRVYAFWGRFPWLYAAQDIATFMGRARAIRGGTVASLKVPDGGAILEVGCGTGRNLSYAVKAAGPEGRVTGLDYSPDMAQAAKDLARKKGWANATFVRSDAARLPFPDNAFDGVFGVLCFSVIPGYKKAIAECRRVLRPGGFFALCDARVFEGPFSVANPLLRKIYLSFAAWDPDRPLVQIMEREFGNVSVKSLNFASFFRARSQKK